MLRGLPFQPDGVAIVGLDGSVRARTSFTPRTPPVVGAALSPLVPPVATVAAGMVFFVDSQGVVRSLDSSGRASTAATFPAAKPQQMVSFAVSPDGQRLMGTVLTLPPVPVPLPSGGRLALLPGAYVQEVFAATNGGPSQLLYREDLTPNVANAMVGAVILAGWDACGPQGVYPGTIASYEGHIPTRRNGTLVRLDAAGRPGQVIGSATPPYCGDSDVIPDGRFVCFNESGLSIRRADGAEIWRVDGGFFWASLAPDAEHSTGTRFPPDGGPGYATDVFGRDGSRVTVPGDFIVQGWLDARTLLGRSGDGYAIFRLGTPGRVELLGVTGRFVGVL